MDLFIVTYNFCKGEVGVGVERSGKRSEPRDYDSRS